MTLELDHFFILTEPGAPQAELLTEIGCLEGAANNHPGQGTSNRRFFFKNTMLELLFVRDEQEAMSGTSKRLGLVDRATGAIASPFGIIARTVPESTSSSFPGWNYHPEFFEDDRYFRIGENSDLLEEPLCLCAAFDLSDVSNQLISANPYDCLTELRISTPVCQPSGVLASIAQIEKVSIRLGEPHLMELVFNDAQECGVVDFRPELPLIINW